VGDIERGRQALESIFSQARAAEELNGYIGLPDGSGGHTVPVSHHPGFNFVRLVDGIEASIGEAINMGAMQDPALGVRIVRENGVLVVKSPSATDAIYIYGDNASGAANPPSIRLPQVGSDTLIGEMSLEGGRLTVFSAQLARLTGLQVRVTACHHRGGYWGGETLITLTPTATASQHSWALVGINTKTNAITQSLTANRSLAQGLLQADIASVIAANPDVDWRGAVDLANGDTTVNVLRIINLRNFGQSNQKTNFSATTAPTVADDSASGYGVGSVWIDTTNDLLWACMDAAAGAAVWKLLSTFAINALTSATLDPAADYIPFYDVSAAGNRYSTLANMLTAPPAIGGGTPAAGSFTTLRIGGAANLSLGGIKFSANGDRLYLPNPSNSTDFGFEYLSTYLAVSLGYFAGARIRWHSAGFSATMQGEWIYASGGSYPSPSLGANNNSSNDVRLAVSKSGNGADRTLTLATQRYAVDGGQPYLKLVARTFEFWTRATGEAAVGGLVKTLDMAESGSWTFYTPTSIAQTTAGSLSSVVNTAILGRNDTGTPLAGFGSGLALQLESSTTPDTSIGSIDWLWNVATHGSRAPDMVFKMIDSAATREIMRMRANGSAGAIGFFGATPVGRAAALTQTYSTADRTLSAYTADDESAAYTGIDNLQSGTIYGQVADVNALRVAYENLRAFTEDLAAFVNALVDDMQGYGLEQ